MGRGHPAASAHWGVHHRLLQHQVQHPVCHQRPGVGEVGAERPKAPVGLPRAQLLRCRQQQLRFPGEGQAAPAL